MRGLIDLTGKTFGYWRVLQRVPTDVIARERFGHGGEAMWYCKCKCGEVHMVYGAALRYGRSHGCQRCSASGRWHGGNSWHAEEGRNDGAGRDKLAGR